MVFGVSGPLPVYQVYLFKFFSVLSYANSAINPFLYAFTNDAFKSAFAEAFSCIASKRSLDPADGGAGRRSNVGARAKYADGDEVQAAVVDHAGCQDNDDAIQLETMITTRQTQTLNNDSQQMRIIVHLEQEQQQQQRGSHSNDPDDDECFL